MKQPNKRVTACFSQNGRTKLSRTHEYLFRQLIKSDFSFLKDFFLCASAMKIVSFSVFEMRI